MTNLYTPRKVFFVGCQKKYESQEILQKFPLKTKKNGTKKVIFKRFYSVHNFWAFVLTAAVNREITKVISETECHRLTDLWINADPYRLALLNCYCPSKVWVTYRGYKTQQHGSYGFSWCPDLKMITAILLAVCTAVFLFLSYRYAVGRPCGFPPGSFWIGIEA